jgi:glycosyltransferase involved in cell wall biosynthesis
LAQARKLGISHVETEWFAFIDSDITLFQGWFRLLNSLKDDGIGGIQGLDQYANESLLRWATWQENVWRKKFLHKKDTNLFYNKQRQLFEM